MGPFFFWSGFEPETYLPSKKLHDISIEPIEKASPSENIPASSRRIEKRKRKASSKASEEQVEVTLTNLQEGEGSSQLQDEGKPPFPSAHKFYVRRSKRLFLTKAESKMPNNNPGPEQTETHSEHILHEEPPPDIVPSSSRSSEDDVQRYKVLIRKRHTRPQNKFRLKSKAMYNPSIKDKVIVIDEEPTNPKAEPIASSEKKK
jgi:hypothetical protein